MAKNKSDKKKEKEKENKKDLVADYLISLKAQIKIQEKRIGALQFITDTKTIRRDNSYNSVEDSIKSKTKESLYLLRMLLYTDLNDMKDELARYASFLDEKIESSKKLKLELQREVVHQLIHSYISTRSYYTSESFKSEFVEEDVMEKLLKELKKSVGETKSNQAINDKITKSYSSDDPPEPNPCCLCKSEKTFPFHLEHSGANGNEYGRDGSIYYICYDCVSKNRLHGTITLSKANSEVVLDLLADSL